MHDHAYASLNWAWKHLIDQYPVYHWQFYNTIIKSLDNRRYSSEWSVSKSYEYCVYSLTSAFYIVQWYTLRWTTVCVLYYSPLVHLAMKTLQRFDVLDFLRVDESTMFNWLQLIESKYHADNPYHNSTHAADVMHATAFFLGCDKLKVRPYTLIWLTSRCFCVRAFCVDEKFGNVEMCHIYAYRRLDNVPFNIRRVVYVYIYCSKFKVPVFLSTLAYGTTRAGFKTDRL